MTNLKDYFMSEIALVITILLVIYWIFRPNSGNYHLRDKEQEIEDLAQDIWRNNRGISYSEAYQRAVEQYQETHKKTKWNFHYYLVCKKQAYH